MKKLIIAGITVAALMSASIAPAFASTTSSGTGSSTTVTTNGLRALW